MPDYAIVIHPASHAAIEAYRQTLVAGEHQPGASLAKALSASSVAALTSGAFIDALLATKPPQIFAESAVYGDGRDWTATELSLLGDINIAVDVTVFDDGRHSHPYIHPTPFPACLLFTPGALLRNDRGGVPADWQAVTKANQIDAAGYRALYERRLLPLFHFASEQAGRQGKQAFVTIPGLGCGQFAGPFIGQMGKHLQAAIHAILEQHAAALPHLKAVWFDPYQECANQSHQLGHITFRVRPLTQGNQDKPQLCSPTHYQEAGDDFSQCRLYSLVAWDHVSWLGNDFYGGARATDDGVKAAATDSMRAMTGIDGVYDPKRHAYQPPKPFSTWGQLVADKHITLAIGDRLRILPAPGNAAGQTTLTPSLEVSPNTLTRNTETAARPISQGDNTVPFRDNPSTLRHTDHQAMSDPNEDRVQEALLALVPEDGTPIGNTALRRDLGERLQAEGISLSDEDYWAAHAALIGAGVLLKGQGRGGSVRRNVALGDADLELAGQTVGPESPKPKTPPPAKPKPAARANPNDTTQVIAYRHLDKRVNNPEVGMVTPATDPDEGKTNWAYDPHIDPALQFDPQRAMIEALIDAALESGDKDRMKEALEELKRLQSPFLNWAGKAERTSFEIDTVSLHVHERIDPASILAAVRKGLNKKSEKSASPGKLQFDLFNAPFENLPLRDAIDFYRHERGWANRLIAGDSLLVMNSLLQKESMAGRVQMIYIDPPYGIKYGSNFQPFVGKRDVKDRNDADLTQEPEMLKAFRDTWELGIHSYLTYLRDRLLLARELLHESGSVFVQISDENLHLTRNLLDEIFGPTALVSIITVAKTAGASSELLPSITDFIVWYAKDISKVRFRQPYSEKAKPDGSLGEYKFLRFPNGWVRPCSKDEREGSARLPENAEPFRPSATTSQRPPGSDPLLFQGKEYRPGNSQFWKTSILGLERLGRAGRLIPRDKSISYLRKFADFPVAPISNLWNDVRWGFDASDKRYVVETNPKVIERCLLMTTDPGDLVLDPTCGSGTTAFVAEKWGRRWITCDTSRVAVTLAKQRLMTASYDYYELRHPHEGLKGGFLYKTVPHVTLKSIANNPDIDTIYEQMHPAIEAALDALNESLAGTPGFKPMQEWEVPFDLPDGWSDIARNHFEAFHAARQAMQKQMDASIAAHADQEMLYDQPAISKSKLRISGPFTVEAVPFPTVKSLDEASGPEEADASIARTGESGRQHQWRDELLKTGIRGKSGQVLRFADLEALPTDQDIRNLHATGHLETGERVVVSFGPEYAALEQRQVSNAMNEASNLFPVPKMIVFCSFAFDPEAAKDIDAIKGITALKAQMNTDLLTEDLKKNRASNESYWLMGQPEVEIKPLPDGQYQVEVHGFDYFDTVKGELVSGGKSKIAMWALDPDYDERSLFPRQVFFPMAGKGEGWEKLKKSIRAELDESRLHQFQGTVSLPFAAGDNRKIAVKIIDDRGIESLKVMLLP